jgi:hypothetical protein
MSSIVRVNLVIPFHNTAGIRAHSAVTVSIMTSIVGLIGLTTRSVDAAWITVN